MLQRTSTIMGSIGARLRLPTLALGSYELVLEPSSIVASGSTVTSWQDTSGNAQHATPSGSPALSAGPPKGVTLDGVNDRLTGTVSLARDVPLSIYILETPQTQASARYTVFALSDTGADDRCSSATMVFTNRVAHVEDDPLNAGWVDTDTILALVRYDFAETHRETYENGHPRAGNAISLSNSRAPTTFRVGGNYAGAGFYKTTVNVVVVVLWDEATHGTPEQELEAEALEHALLNVGTLDPPDRFADKAEANIGDEDPRILLRDTIPINVVVGTPLHLQKGPITCVSTAVAPTRDGQLAPILSSPDPEVTITEYADRWLVDVSGPGDYELELTVGAFSETATLHAVAALSGGSGTRRVLIVGDSNTNRGWFVQFVGDGLGAHGILLGTQSNAGYDYDHQGQDGYSFENFNSDGTVQGTTSPYRTGGALDFGAFTTSLGGQPPDLVIYAVGTNLPTGTNDGDINEALDDELGVHGEAIIGGSSEAWPGVGQIVLTPPPGNGDPEVWGNEGSRCLRLRNMHRVTERMFEDLGEREAEKLFVELVGPCFDNWRGYPGANFAGADAIHMNAYPGHKQISLRILAALTAHWTVPNVLRVVSATVSGLTANKLTVVYSEAVTAPNATGLALDFTTGTARTITGVDSGSTTITHVYALSGSVSATDVLHFRIGATRSLVATSGGRKVALARVSVTLDDFDAVPLLLGVDAWYRTDDAGASISQAGGLISQWSDSSGNAFHATEGGANKPSYVADFGDGRPAVSHTSGKHLVASAPIDITGDYTVILFMRYALNGGTTSIGITKGDSVTDQYGLTQRCLFANARHRLYDGTADNDITDTSAPVDEWHVIVLRRTANTQKVSIDEAGNGASGTVTATFTGIDTLTIGGYKIGAGFGTYVGHFAELQFYGAHLSDGDVATAIADIHTRNGNSGATR